MSIHTVQWALVVFGGEWGGTRLSNNLGKNAYLYSTQSAVMTLTASFDQETVDQDNHGA